MDTDILGTDREGFPTSDLRPLISPNYRELNQRLHLEVDSYGARGYRYLEEIRGLCERYGARSVLDYGCGKGALAEVWDVPGVELVSWDPCCPPFDTVVPVPCDLVWCSDVLEHVEPEMVGAALDDLRRLTLKAGRFVISTRLDPDKTLPDGSNPHRSVHPLEWWHRKLKRRFKVVEAKRRKYHAGFLVESSAQ